VDTDLLIDRWRLKRRLAIWQLLTVVVLVALIAALARPALPPTGEHVGLLWVDGVILGDPVRERAIYDLVDQDDLAALVVRIDSPGGGTFGSESLFRALRAVAVKKPVVAVLDGVAASGGYMTALAADQILLRETTITGSIGVVVETSNFVALFEKIGIEPDAVRSGPLKARPNPFERMNPEVRAVTQELVDRTHDWFVGLVAERRNMTIEDARRLADGRIYTGAAAVANGLADALGGEREAREWLEREHQVDRSLPLREVKIDYPNAWIDTLTSMVFGKSYFSQRLKLDGLVSLWHPLLGS
jgi:protease-4